MPSITGIVAAAVSEVDRPPLLRRRLASRDSQEQMVFHRQIVPNGTISTARQTLQQRR